MDWRNFTTRLDEFEFYMLDPVTLTRIGDLSGVLISDTKITFGRYTDTRVSVSGLDVMNSNYIENSLIQIVHKVKSENYTNVLGTFYVTNIDGNWEFGVFTGTLELHSMLYAYTEDLWYYHFSINQGEYIKDVFSRIFRITRRPYKILDSTNNTRLSSTTIYKVGDTIISTLFDLCSICSARLEVDQFGYTIIKPDYVSTTPIFEFSDPDSMIIGPISISDSKFSASGRSIVLYQNGDTEIVARANVAPGHFADSRLRGRMVTTLHNLSTLDPATGAHAQELAQQYIKQDSAETIEYKFQSRYFPVTESDCILLPVNGTRHLCMVKNVDISLQSMLLDLTVEVIQ